MAGKLTAVGPGTEVEAQRIDGVRVPSTFELRLVADLLPNPKNSRDHSKAQVAELAEHIKSVGWTNPVLVAGNEVLAGHGRIMAAKVIGMTRVPVIDLSHLSDAERRAYIIWDNRSAEKSSWNLEFLKMETDDLRALGLDLEEVTGFAEEDLAKLFEGLDVPDEGGGGDPDDVPPVPDAPKSVEGDVWVCGPHRVMCGSSLDPKAWFALMAGTLADMVWTDPPYNVDIGGKNKRLDATDRGNRSKTGGIMNDKMENDSFKSFLDGVYGCLFDVVKAGGTVYVAHADVEGHNFRTAFLGAGFKLQSCLIWHKNNFVIGRWDFQPKHEPILYGWKPGAGHRWFGGRKQTTVVEYGDGSPFTLMPDGRWQIKIGDSVMVVDGNATVTETPGTMIYEPKPARSDLHPTQKPVALVERMLKNSARPGDVVADAFGGSGTTMIAADRLGMCARLMELDPKFVDVIVTRWQQFTGRRAVHAVTGLPFPSEEEARVPDAPAEDALDDSIF